MRVEDITDDLARESGFPGVDDLLAVAKHGPGDNVYLIRFHYLAPRRMGYARAEPSRTARGRTAQRQTAVTMRPIG